MFIIHSAVSWSENTCNLSIVYKVKNIILKVHCIEAACKDAFPIIGQDSGELLNKQDIQTWWVLDHISNRWSNNYPEPDKNRILTRQKYLKSIIEF